MLSSALSGGAGPAEPPGQQRAHQLADGEGPLRRSALAPSTATCPTEDGVLADHCAAGAPHGAVQGAVRLRARNITSAALAPLVAALRATICTKAPQELDTWTATEVAFGLPLGDSAPLHPMAQARLLQLRWLQRLANSAGIAGVVHRAVACPATDWREPSVALHRNLSGSRSTPWPHLAPEPAPTGTVLLAPADAEDSEP